MHPFKQIVYNFLSGGLLHSLLHLIFKVSKAKNDFDLSQIRSKEKP